MLPSWNDFQYISHLSRDRIKSFILAMNGRRGDPQSLLILFNVSDTFKSHQQNGHRHDARHLLTTDSDWLP